MKSSGFDIKNSIQDVDIFEKHTFSNDSFCLVLQRWYLIYMRISKITIMAEKLKVFSIIILCG